MDLDLFKPKYTFRHLHETSELEDKKKPVLTRTRVNQWRLRKLLPAEVEHQGSGFHAEFSLWSLVHAECLALFSNTPGISLSVATEILNNVKGNIKSNYKFILGKHGWEEGIEKMVAVIDIGDPRYTILSLSVGKDEYLGVPDHDTGKRKVIKWSNLHLVLYIGQMIKDKVRQVKALKE